MPLERKIMLSILISITAFFALYFVYSELYVPYKADLEKIERLETYISKVSNKIESKEPEDFSKLLNRSEELNSYFFDEDTFSMDSFAGDIKDVLLRNGVQINQFRTGDKSITFNIEGERKSILPALLSLSNRKPFYSFGTLQLRVDKDRKLQGVISLSPTFYPTEPDETYLSDTVRFKDYRGQYSKSLADIFGEPVLETIKEEIIEEPEEIIPVKSTDKFSYIGVMKNQDEKTYMFRETTNGRVFIFSFGGTISGWKLSEIRENSFIFENEEKLYEVEKWKN